MAVYWAISEQTFNTHDTSALVGATSVWAPHTHKNRKIVQYEVKFEDISLSPLNIVQKLEQKRESYSF